MKTITKDQLKSMIDNKDEFTLVNVLPEQYFKDNHIPNSLNIPVSDSDFKEKVSKHLPDKTASIVVYCASFECQASTDALKKITEMGYKNVVDYEGGMKDWTET